jgi:DNA polymerase III subunit beta
MHVAVSKKDLLRILARCQGVADKKSTMPVLGNVLLAVDGADKLRLAATDLYLSVTGSVRAEVEKGGSIAVGARDLFDRIKAMPEGQLVLSSPDGASLSVKASGSARRYTLHGIPGEEFPSLPEPDPAGNRSRLGVDTMARLVGATHFSISTDETRLHLNSALLEWEADRVRMVTTDGHRLSKIERRVTGELPPAAMLIPLKGIHELRRLCDEARAERGEGPTPEVLVSQTGPNAFFEIAGLRFSVKLVDAQFPPYPQVIPRTSDRAVTAPRAFVSEALNAVRIAASDRTGGVKLTLAPGVIRLSSESPESGDGFDELPVDYAGGEVTIGFNAKYLLDVLGAIEQDDVIIGISGELDPVVIRPAGERDEESFVAVIMPMRI